MFCIQWGCLHSKSRRQSCPAGVVSQSNWLHETPIEMAGVLSWTAKSETAGAARGPVHSGDGKGTGHPRAGSGRCPPVPTATRWGGCGWRPGALRRRSTTAAASVAGMALWGRDGRDYVGQGGGAMFAVGRQQPAGVALAHPQSSAAGAMGTWYSKTELST